MGSELAALRIREALKRLLKRNKKTYGEAAVHLGVSQATVKRALNGEELSLNRLMAFCDFLGVTLTDLETEAHGNVHNTGYAELSEEQESILAADTDLFFFFNKLRLGMSVDFIKKQTGLTRASVNAYLRDCETLGLIKMSDAGHPKLIKHGWKRGGPLAALLGELLTRGFRDYIFEKAFSEEKGVIPLNTGTAHFECADLTLSPEGFADYRQKLRELESEVIARWGQEQRLAQKGRGVLYFLHMFHYAGDGHGGSGPDVGISRLAERV